MKMPVISKTFWAIVLVLPMFAGADSLPSFKDDAAAHQKRRASSGSSMSKADMAIIQSATKDLNAALPAPGLKVGDTAPDFTLPAAGGETVRLSTLLASGPVVLTFYRGAWCPYCSMQLQGLSRSKAAFEKYDAQIIAITPQTLDKSEAQQSEKALAFPLLSDLDNKVMKAYKVHFKMSSELDGLYQSKFGLDVSAFNGEGRLDLPVPGTFVVGRDGKIKAAFADTDYKKRMEPSEIVDALKALR
jgi:peroxiredoxin